MENMVIAEANHIEIKPKMKFTGKVIKLNLAGAVIDLGVAKGVLHISQIPSPTPGQPIKHIREVLQEGQTLDVWVRRVKGDRIELTLKKPLDLEWKDIKPDMVVKGKVVRIEPFGAFVDIGAERPGLIHISELSHGYVKTPTEVVQEGDEVEVKIIEVIRKKKQIKLSLKALQPEPIQEPRPQPAEEKKHTPVEKREPQTHEPAASKEKSREKGREKRRKRARGSTDENIFNLDELISTVEESQPTEAEPTVMELALREAMERAKQRKEAAKAKKAKTLSAEQEAILSRTLEHRSNISQS
ncbi:MAG: S1 RNA-binding domain-containing protein [Thermanaerothrix sp.]|uniref:S1 RNA-binding domain-containing protein n=1 Tax=Thermanaerothrix solaris TaxID=3058434 RepID=A0ABU3NIP9_9CHLR|nr:S1 RNA-binding domain-containing protein [Thermanaerothrix sp. 4228-RoL]MDT8896735.1 S1 RNA-binding domain-containing protein [Thermanaerothrix sp. 4228-RoL]